MSVTACVTYERRVEKPRGGFAYYAGTQMLFRVLPSVIPYGFSSKRETAHSLLFCWLAIMSQSDCCSIFQWRVNPGQNKIACCCRLVEWLTEIQHSVWSIWTRESVCSQYPNDYSKESDCDVSLAGVYLWNNKKTNWLHQLSVRPTSLSLSFLYSVWWIDTLCCT